jgi:hypothetical protein
MHVHARACARTRTHTHTHTKAVFETYQVLSELDLTFPASRKRQGVLHQSELLQKVKVQILKPA